ncbi:Protein of uncharacterised function (DUF328) [uncultured Clostridium sp.]|nr:peroxide stress protein YaaA [uncultured Clostridium sp.]SCI72701.1 Protein of uncharacterised function (DUF328) [uncultured Clostridium sp.]
MRKHNINIIISPAKKMTICDDDLSPSSTPCFMKKTTILYETLKSFSCEELKKLLDCNDQIAELNYDRYLHMDFDKAFTPAILSYEGIQYKYMSPNSFSNTEFEYINKHLKIISGFYGVLKPFDGVTPYRLEMQAKLKANNFKDLYSFWDNNIYREVNKDCDVILNLASKEYSKTVEKYLSPDDKYITCVFGALKDSKIKVKATEAKMARGLMVKYLAKNNIYNVEDIKNFSDLAFKYSERHSSENEFVFLK